MFRKIRKWYLKHHKFDIWWEELCKEKYCNQCRNLGKNIGNKCHIDYLGGKCVNDD